MRHDSDLSFRGVSADAFDAKGRKVVLLRDASLDVPRGRVALVGPSPGRCSAVVDLAARRAMPWQGSVVLPGRVSWAIGRLAAFSGYVRGTQAVSFVCSLYGVPHELGLDFAAREMGGTRFLSTRISKWSAEARTRLGLVCALLPQFDVYLVDGNVALANQPEFTERWLEMFAERVRGRTLLISSRQTKVLREWCTSAVAIEDGRLVAYPDVDDALAASVPAPDARRDEEPAAEVQDDDLSDPILG